MGYMTLIAACYQCGKTFTANPSLVPSLRLRSGDQVVFCRACVEGANPIRIANGLQPITIRPGAYEPEPENPYEAMIDDRDV
jgi:hypothetical protein